VQHQYKPWGAAPGFAKPKKTALKARFTLGANSIIIHAKPQSISKVILHVIFSTKNRESWRNSMCGHACTRILRQSAVIWAPTSLHVAVWLTMFTLSPRCRELLLKPNSSRWNESPLQRLPSGAIEFLGRCPRAIVRTRLWRSIRAHSHTFLPKPICLRPFSLLAFQLSSFPAKTRFLRDN